MSKMADRCESCEHYEYDEQTACYCCGMELDEDEMCLFLAGNTGRCPYYRCGDEYDLVKHQN